MQYLVYILGGTIAFAAFVFLTILVVMPRMNWSAATKPGAMESRIANGVRERWIAIHAPNQKNPLPPTPDNLASGRKDYDEHCGVCHGIDGGGRNRFEADFYPPVARLTGAAREISDAEIYFVIVNDVALSAMPAFGEHHSSQEI
jgi:mono/diheme cytochrome c family protein